MGNKILLVGGFHEIIELAENESYVIVGIIDKQGEGVYRDYSIISDDKNAVFLDPKFKAYPILITPDEPITRERLYEYYNSLGYHFTSLISNKSIISKTAVVKNGSIIQTGVHVSAESVIGQFVKLNTNSNIMHNAIINDFTTIAPNAIILGNVTIGKYCYIGANSTILPNISICDSVIIGAGAIVTKDIFLAGTYIGNPARLLK